MKTPLCSTCGCSLVRLGITKENAIYFSYQEKAHCFCCAGCLDVFKTNSDALLRETENLIVCPVCLAEKPGNESVEYDFNGEIFNFCRCPYCLNVFKQDQDYYIQRLAWQADYPGIFGDQEGCCKPN